MRTATPFNPRVPKGLRRNLRWRREITRRAAVDPKFAAAVREAAARDPLFFINAFGWTYDPRRQDSTKLPFLLYPFQEDAILEIIDAIGDYDLLVEKSRDMGASWLCIAAIAWCWLFRSGQSFLFVSRVEDYVDKPGNPKALFWKFDYLIENLPPWLRPAGYNPEFHRSRLHVVNPENGSVIDGESTTGNVARGDRRTAILLDEFAAVEQGNKVLTATRDATNCRLFNSTPAGTNNAFYEIRQTSIKKLRLHWSQHPHKSAGLYTTDGQGNLKVLDAAGYPEGYEPILDGKLRSPWYDAECARAGSLHEIAQELDIDYLGSGYQFFNADAIQAAIRRDARPPILVGDLEYDDTTAEPIRFRENPKGNLRLWFLLDREGHPPKDLRYVIGADTSAGTGASNSCLEAYAQVTCDKAAEYVNPYIRPEQFAKQGVALALWLNKAFLIWENNGPGRQFGSRVVELKYGNIYYRKREEAISGKTSDIPGWAATRETKLVLMGDYRAAVEKGECINRSKEALEDALEYIFGPNGEIIHARATDKIDPSGARDNHGDRVIGDALAWKGIGERVRNPKSEEPEVPIGCLAWRNKMREQEKQPTNSELPRNWR